VENLACPLISQLIETAEKTDRVLAADFQQVMVRYVKHEALGYGGSVAGSPALNKVMHFKRKEQTTKQKMSET
jgi:hypothetical protein